jgi:ABC-2 type transport system permease protein
MPPWLAAIMECSPSTHFVSFAQAILYRGAGITTIWPEFLIIAGVASLFLAAAIWRFRVMAAQAG